MYSEQQCGPHCTESHLISILTYHNSVITHEYEGPRQVLKMCQKSTSTLLCEKVHFSLESSCSLAFTNAFPNGYSAHLYRVVKQKLHQYQKNLDKVVKTTQLFFVVHSPH